MYTEWLRRNGLYTPKNSINQVYVSVINNNTHQRNWPSTAGATCRPQRTADTQFALNTQRAAFTAIQYDKQDSQRYLE
jgi:hypothetical protein